MLKTVTWLVLLLVLANCAPQDTTNAAGEANPQEVFEIEGELTYRERIALPPQATTMNCLPSS